MTRFRALAPVTAVVVLTASLLVAPSVALAQAPPARPTPPAPAAAPFAPPVFVENQDARETRQALMEVLRRYPPSLGHVLKLDPSLVASPAYVVPYPALNQFLQQHPEVIRSPGYYYDSISDDFGYRSAPVSDGDRAIDMWRNIMGDLFVLLNLSVVFTAIAWMIRSVIEHRRWSRLSKVQAEVHNKLIDRLASNDEMLAYIQSPAGAGFLRAGPIDMGTGAKSMHAPFGRILWSAQAGVVLLALGLGLRWVTVSAPNEVVEMLHFCGIIGQALGLGFIASAGLSYVLSRRMGLIGPTAPVERDTPSRS